MGSSLFIPGRVKDPAFLVSEIASAEGFERNQEMSADLQKKHSSHRFESISEKEPRWSRGPVFPNDLQLLGTGRVAQLA